MSVLIGRATTIVRDLSRKPRRFAMWVQWVRGKRGYGEVTIDRRTWRRWQIERLLGRH